MNLFTPDPHTLLFNAVLEEFPVSDPTPQGPTKRQRHKAGRLTQKVWDSLTNDPNADTTSIEVTQELEMIK